MATAKRAKKPTKKAAKKPTKPAKASSKSTKPAPKRAKRTTKPTKPAAKRTKPAVKSAKPAKSAATPAHTVSGTGIDAALSALDRFVENVTSLGESGPLFLARLRSLPPCGRAALAKFESEWNRKVPDDVAAFWSRGVANFSIDGRDGELYAMTRFDAPGTPPIKTARKIFRDEAKVHGDALGYGDYSQTVRPGYFERGRLYVVGIPLIQDENYLVWDTERGGVWQTSGEPSEVPNRAVAPTFTEFLRHYIAAGCFHCGTASKKRFDEYWKLVQPHVPIAIPPRENLWLQHLSRFYRSKDAIFPNLK